MAGEEYDTLLRVVLNEINLFQGAEGGVQREPGHIQQFGFHFAHQFHRVVRVMQVPGNPNSARIIFHLHALVNEVDIGNVECTQAAVIRCEFVEDRFQVPRPNSAPLPSRKVLNGSVERLDVLTWLYIGMIPAGKPSSGRLRQSIWMFACNLPSSSECVVVK